MNGPTLAILIILVAVLILLLSLLVLQWILMKREQRRIEDLVELRARQGGSAAAGEVGRENRRVDGARGSKKDEVTAAAEV